MNKNVESELAKGIGLKNNKIEIKCGYIKSKIHRETQGQRPKKQIREDN